MFLKNVFVSRNQGVLSSKFYTNECVKIIWNRKNENMISPKQILFEVSGKKSM